MCQYTTTNLSATECGLITSGQPAHVYQKVYYWLCSDSHSNRLCSNVVPKEEQIGSDAGSRQGRCPVCDRTNDAEDEYNTAIARATEAYNRIVNRAWEKKEDEKASANYVIETFPYRRNREHHRHRYSGYASSMIE